MSRVFMYTGTRFSNSAKLVARLMGIRRIRVRNSRYRSRVGDTIINWGSAVKTARVSAPYLRWINSPPLRGINKLTCFNILREHGVSIPDYSTSPAVARQWLDGLEVVLARHTLTGSGGMGITVLDPRQDRGSARQLSVPSAPLYVKYIPKKYEVRIHVRKIVENGEAKWSAFDWQQKLQRRGTDANHRIRSHDNGFIFARHGTTIGHYALDKCQVEAVKAVRAMGMDFGAVDVIFNEYRNQAYVLEINSSPGVENSTAQNYAQMLRSLVRG